MDFEVKIISNLKDVKNYLKENSIHYQEDFLIDDIVFVTVHDLDILKHINKDINYKPEEYAFQ